MGWGLSGSEHRFLLERLLGGFVFLDASVIRRTLRTVDAGKVRSLRHNLNLTFHWLLKTEGMDNFSYDGADLTSGSIASEAPSKVPSN